jgi:hypothetical protein
MEKRSKTRFYDQGSVICSHFNVDRRHDAQMLNFSQSGMCFQTDQSFKPGTTVLIRLNQCPEGDAVRQAEGGLRNITLAKVRWCHDEHDLPLHRFVSGVQYL